MGTQENDSSVPAAPQDAHKLASNGVVAQMEQDKEKEERNSASVRIETAELVNGDMGDGSAEQSDDHSPPHTDRTGREIHTKNEDSGTESEHRNGEGSTDQKVRACLLCYLHPLCHVFKAVSFLCSLRYFQISDLQH